MRPSGEQRPSGASSSLFSREAPYAPVVLRWLWHWLSAWRSRSPAETSRLTCAVYHSTRKGLELLAMHFEDPRFLALSCQRPQWTSLAHVVAIGEQRLLIDQAAVGEKEFCVENWTSEFDIVNKEAEAPEDRFCLYTLLSQGPCGGDSRCSAAALSGNCATPPETRHRLPDYFSFLRAPGGSSGLPP
jgi:hypothetical protein